jgi:hypothetical protein
VLSETRLLWSGETWSPWFKYKDEKMSNNWQRLVHLAAGFAACSATTNPPPSRLLRGEAAAAAAGQVSFVTLGDWGGATLGDYHETDEKAVAKTLAAAAASLSAQFLVNVGDNHYYYGVKSATDPAWKTNFEDVYTAKSLAIPWYSVLGNREFVEGGRRKAEGERMGWKTTKVSATSLLSFRCFCFVLVWFWFYTPLFSLSHQTCFHAPLSLYPLRASQIWIWIFRPFPLRLSLTFSLLLALFCFLFCFSFSCWGGAEGRRLRLLAGRSAQIQESGQRPLGDAVALLLKARGDRLFRSLHFLCVSRRLSLPSGVPRHGQLPMGSLWWYVFVVVIACHCHCRVHLYNI